MVHILYFILYSVIYVHLVVWQADPLVSLHVCAKFLREDDETGECEKAYPRYWDIWALLDKMAGVHFRARH